MNAIILAIDAGHIAQWVREPPRVTALNAMAKAREVAGLCKACGEPWPCGPILEARQGVARHARQAAS